MGAELFRPVQGVKCGPCDAVLSILTGGFAANNGSFSRTW